MNKKIEDSDEPRNESKNEEEENMMGLDLIGYLLD